MYTPPGYEASSGPYPVIMLLAGFAGTGEQMLGRGLSDVSIASRADRLIADGCPPFLLVLPDCMTTVGGSQFIDSAGIGAYGTYVGVEIPEFVDTHFRTSSRWGVAGRSSGGFGSLSLAMDYPERFGAVACHAGDMGFDLCYLGDLGPAIRGIRKLGGLLGFHEAFWREHRPSSDLFAAFNIIAMSCAYSPAPGNEPLPARLPIDVETGEVHFDVLTSWRRYDPLVRVQTPEAASALRQLDLLFLDAGAWDEYHLQLGARRFVEHLKQRDIDHEYEEFPGGHRGTTWRYDVSLPKLARALTP